MIMDTMLQNIPQRLHEVNTLLATCRQGVFSFGEALPLSLFYRDFSDTNLLVKEAVCLVKENPGRLLDFPLPCFWKPKPTCPLTGHRCRRWTLNLFSGNISNLLNTATRKRKQPPPDSGASILQRATGWTSCLWMRKNTACSMRNAVRQRRSMTKPMRTRTIYTRSGCRNATGILRALFQADVP